MKKKIVRISELFSYGIAVVALEILERLLSVLPKKLLAARNRVRALKERLKERAAA